MADETIQPVFRFSLRARILLLMAGTAAGATLLALLSVYIVTLSQERRMVEESVHSTAALAEQHLQDRTLPLANAISVMATQPTIISYLMLNADARNDWDTVSGVAEEFGQQINADVIVLTDASGRAVGEYTRRPVRSGVTASTAAPVRPTKRTPDRTDYSSEPGVSDVLNDTVDTNAGGASKVWTGFAVRRNHLYTVARIAVRAPGGGYVRGVLSAYAAVDETMAREIARTSGCDVAFQRGTTVYGASLRTADLSDIGTSATDVQINGVRYVAEQRVLKLYNGTSVHSVPLHSEPLSLVVLYPWERASALPRRLEAALLLPFPVVLLFAFLVSLVVSRGLAHPLEAVVDAARTLQKGEWPARFRTTRADEIGLLQTVFDDMSDSLRTAQERLLSLIDTDPLTELDNHRRFQERLAQETERSAASGEPLALLLIDLDHFHAYNQRVGHAAGDDALRRAANSLRAVLPPLAVAARYGGEEFAVLLPRHNACEAGEVSETVRKAITQETLGGLTVSVGYAGLRRDDPTPESLTLAAELALAQAKLQGRDRVCGFESLSAAVGGGTDSSGNGSAHLYRFLRDGSLSTIQALAAAVDAKDPYTRGHSQRVAESAAELARRIGLPPSEVDLVYTTGTLHDVGKIGVPDRILQKEGRLDEDERRLMESHTILGEVIVGKAPPLAETLSGVRHHHERWDGRGYPDGLAGDDIPLIARILALADTFDAMTSDRPYRTGLPIERALEEIDRCAGTQFDPELAEVFISSYRATACPDPVAV